MSGKIATYMMSKTNRQHPLNLKLENEGIYFSISLEVKIIGDKSVKFGGSIIYKNKNNQQTNNVNDQSLQI